MCSKFSRKCLSSATGKLYINIITFIRQIELCGFSRHPVCGVPDARDGAGSKSGLTVGIASF